MRLLLLFFTVLSTICCFAQYSDENVKNKSLKAIQFEDGSIYHFSYFNDSSKFEFFSPYDTVIVTEYCSANKRLDSSIELSWNSTAYDSFEKSNDSFIVSLWADTTHIIRKSYYIYDSIDRLDRVLSYINQKLDDMEIHKYNSINDTTLLYSSYKDPDNYIIDSIFFDSTILYSSYKWVKFASPDKTFKVQKYLYPEILKNDSTIFYLNTSSQVYKEIDYSGIVHSGCIRYPNKKRHQERFHTINDKGDIIKTVETAYILDNGERIDEWTKNSKFRYEYYSTPSGLPRVRASSVRDSEN